MPLEEKMALYPFTKVLDEECTDVVDDKEAVNTEAHLSSSFLFSMALSPEEV